MDDRNEVNDRGSAAGPVSIPPALGQWEELLGLQKEQLRLLVLLAEQGRAASRAAAAPARPRNARERLPGRVPQAYSTPAASFSPIMP
jgi:hypothetical protein